MKNIGIKIGVNINIVEEKIILYLQEVKLSKVNKI
jgi:hypothetical protein